MKTRRLIREHLANLIRVHAEHAKAVYDYQVGDFVDGSPVVAVTSAGSHRQPFTFKGSRPTFFLNIEVFVLYADPDATPVWTEADAEDAIDALEMEIADAISGHVTEEGYWSHMKYETRSLVSTIVLDGTTYLWEVIPVEVEVL